MYKIKYIVNHTLLDKYIIFEIFENVFPAKYKDNHINLIIVIHNKIHP